VGSRRSLVVVGSDYSRRGSDGGVSMIPADIVPLLHQGDARELGRRSVGFELNPKSITLAWDRKGMAYPDILTVGVK